MRLAASLGTVLLFIGIMGVVGGIEAGRIPIHVGIALAATLALAALAYSRTRQD